MHSAEKNFVSRQHKSHAGLDFYISVTTRELRWCSAAVYSKVLRGRLRWGVWNLITVCVYDSEAEILSSGCQRDRTGDLGKKKCLCRADVTADSNLVMFNFKTVFGRLERKLKYVFNL